MLDWVRSISQARFFVRFSIVAVSTTPGTCPPRATLMTREIWWACAPCSTSALPVPFGATFDTKFSLNHTRYISLSGNLSTHLKYFPSTYIKNVPESWGQVTPSLPSLALVMPCSSQLCCLGVRCRFSFGAPRQIGLSCVSHRFAALKRSEMLWDLLQSWQSTI